jgi:transposase
MIGKLTRGLSLKGTTDSRVMYWRRIHTRYNRCAQTFLSAVRIAAAVIFWL